MSKAIAPHTQTRSPSNKTRSPLTLQIAPPQKKIALNAGFAKRAIALD
ncbi:hypothetical protein AB3R30_16360 [Leptolyngbyaceae cyanobacterium UHCC 1019]